MKRIVLILIGLGLSWNVQAATISEFVALFTPTNIARFLPGYSAAQYANMSKLMQVDFAGNADCQIVFEGAQTSNPQAYKANGDACGLVMDAAMSSYGLLGIDWSPLQQILGLYGTQIYAATVSPQIMLSTTTRYIDGISSVLHSVGNQRKQGGPARFALGGGNTGLAGGRAGQSSERLDERWGQ